MIFDGLIETICWTSLKYHGLLFLTILMPQFKQLLPDIWKEACRHIGIFESSAAIERLLSRHLPLDQLMVRRFDEEHKAIATVAVAPVSKSNCVSENRRAFTPPEWGRCLTWCRNSRILTRGKRLTGTLGLILPEEITRDVLAASLVSQQGPQGVLLLIAKEGRIFEESHQEMLEALREPFSVALENDRRLHELASLREAAEADRGALLRRLGRKDLGDTIIGEQSGLRLVMQRVELVTQSDVPVLILGETGTGKELVARALHVRSPRHEGPFIRVNCGAIPQELIDSQLFGHERGSFTGADQSRQGWFERADGGTLFLDEIGELPLEAQVRFLRVLQDGFIERVGGNQPIHVDVRVVAATHRDLAQMVREGRFREDLWYRLAVFPLLLPPLRDRRDDIPELANHFAERAATRFGLPVVLPSPHDLHLLQTYHWPGNIRELGAVIDRAAILGDGRSLEVAKALGWSDSQPGQPLHVVSSWKDSPRPPHTKDHVPSLDEAMKSHIELVLKLTEGQIEGRNGAAAILKINPHTLRARMRKLKIDWSQYR